MAAPSSKDRITFRTRISMGESDDEIMGSTKWTRDYLEDVRAAVIAEAVTSIHGKGREDIYAEYLIRSTDNIRQLSDVTEIAQREDGDLRVAVGAIKAKQDILRESITVGQDLGFIPRKPQQTQISVLVAGMSNTDLKAMLATEVAETQRLVGRHGTTRFLALEAGPSRKAIVDAKDTSLTCSRPEREAVAVPKNAKGLAGLARSVVQQRLLNARSRAAQGAGSHATP